MMHAIRPDTSHISHTNHTKRSKRLHNSQEWRATFDMCNMCSQRQDPVNIICWQALQTLRDSFLHEALESESDQSLQAELDDLDGPIPV